jgi:hypothetical protein
MTTTDSEPDSSDAAPRDSIRRFRSGWVAPVALTVFTIAVFLHTLDYGLYLDDHHHARPWEFGEVMSTFWGPFDTLGIEPAYYRPLVVVTFGLDWAIWGFDDRGYHITNLVLHVVAVLMVYAVINRLIRHRVAAAVGAAAFSVLPANVATVLYISERSDALVAIFTCAAVLAVCTRHDRPDLRWPTLAVPFACLLAIMSKEVGLAAPLIVAATWCFLEVDRRSEAPGTWSAEASAWLDIVRDPDRRRGLIRTAGPPVLVAVAAFGYRALVLPEAFVEAYGDKAGGPLRGLVGGIRWTILATPWEVRNLAFIPLIAATIAVAFVHRRPASWRPMIFAALWVLASLVPLARLVSVEPRLLYTAEVGMAIFIAGLTRAAAPEIVRAVRRSSPALGRRRGIGLAVFLVSAVGWVAATIPAHRDAQLEFRVGSPKMLNGDLIVWTELPDRNFYEPYHLERIRQRLFDAGLIDEDGVPITP